MNAHEALTTIAQVLVRLNPGDAANGSKRALVRVIKTAIEQANALVGGTGGDAIIAEHELRRRYNVDAAVYS